jgi:hypothetical protein
MDISVRSLAEIDSTGQAGPFAHGLSRVLKGK